MASRDVSNLDFDDHDFEHIRIGSSECHKVRAALSDEISRVSLHASAQYVASLEPLLFEFIDIFRLQLGPDPPVKIDPAVIELLPNATPVLCKPRNLPPLHVDFLSDHF